jgi:hypothetical protein
VDNVKQMHVWITSVGAMPRRLTKASYPCYITANLCKHGVLMNVDGLEN